MAKTPANSDVIYRSIEHRIQDVIRTPIPANPFDLLARVHALLLYQIIRLFDGDIRARVSAEATRPALETASDELFKHVRLHEDPFPDITGGSFLHDTNNMNVNDPSSTAITDVTRPGLDSHFDLLQKPLRGAGAAPSEAIAKFWRTWLWQESARRTFLMVAFFMQAYRLINREPMVGCDGKLHLCHMFTISAHLWRANDAFEFAQKWKEKRHFVVANAK
jgi:hypothetical protein